MINQQSAEINRERVRYEATQTLLSVTCTNKRSLALNLQMTSVTESGPQQQQIRPSYCLLKIHYEWRSLSTGGQPSRPRGHSHMQCCSLCCSSRRSNRTTTTYSSFIYAFACDVYILVVCMYVRVPTKFTNALLLLL